MAARDRADSLVGRVGKAAGPWVTGAAEEVGTVDLDELWAAIDRQRLRTVDLLHELPEEEWRRPSLCEGWTVRDVAAHLTMQQMTVGDALKAALRHPGSINHLIRESARHQASLPPEQLAPRPLRPAPHDRLALGPLRWTWCRKNRSNSCTMSISRGVHQMQRPSHAAATLHCQ